MRDRIREFTRGDRYDLVVLGGGSAGLSLAKFAGRLGARVAIVEGGRFGGDCTWYGCVPSKALLAAGHAAAAARDAVRLGLPRFEPGEPIDLGAVLDRIHDVQQHIHDEDDSPEHLRSLGVDVFEDYGRFMSPDTLHVGTEELSGRHFVIATGSQPSIPPIEGLEDVPHLTNETIFTELRELPRRLLVVGGGPIGLELGQALARLGSAVTIVELEPRILPGGEPDASGTLQRALEAEDIRFALGSRVARVAREGSRRCAFIERAGGDGETSEVEFDALLIATGRRPNVADLGLEAAGVVFDERRGIKVNQRLRTSNRRISAVGDVIGPPLFTHSAADETRIVLYNVLTPLRKRADYSLVPAVTYTDPEVASVGLGEAAARRRYGEDVRVYRSEVARNDRARAEGRTRGFAKLVCTGKQDRIVGAHLVGPAAGEYISEYTLAMRHELTAADIMATIHPYPTYSQAPQYAAVQALQRSLDRRLVRLAIGAKRTIGRLLDRLR